MHQNRIILRGLFPFTCNRCQCYLFFYLSTYVCIYLSMYLCMYVFYLCMYVTMYVLRDLTCLRLLFKAIILYLLFIFQVVIRPLLIPYIYAVVDNSFNGSWFLGGIT